MIECNGVFRPRETQLVNIDGVWRQVDSQVCINGVWRKAGQRINSLYPEQIKSFAIIYSKYTNKKDNMEYNSQLSKLVKADVTSHETDTEKKSFIFQYDNSPPKIYGAYVYRAVLYAETNEKTMIDIGSVLNARNSLKSDMEVILNMQTTHIHTGRKFTGWNQLFTFDNLLKYDNNDFASGDMHINILPTGNRDLKYRDSIYIGIKRDPDVDVNMNGGEGYIDHEFDSITVNGTPYPFRIEII